MQQRELELREVKASILHSLYDKRFQRRPLEHVEREGKDVACVVLRADGERSVRNGHRRCWVRRRQTSQPVLYSSKYIHRAGVHFDEISRSPRVKMRKFEISALFETNGS